MIRWAMAALGVSRNDHLAQMVEQVNNPVINPVMMWNSLKKTSRAVLEMDEESHLQEAETKVQAAAEVKEDTKRSKKSLFHHLMKLWVQSLIWTTPLMFSRDWETSIVNLGPSKNFTLLLSISLQKEKSDAEIAINSLLNQMLIQHQMKRWRLIFKWLITFQRSWFTEVENTLPIKDLTKTLKSCWNS